MLEKFILIGIFSLIIIKLLDVLKEYRRIKSLNKKIEAFDRLKARREFQKKTVSNCNICGGNLGEPVEIAEGDKIICSPCNKKYSALRF